ncbi:twin-arginine translocation signal domain-containing protein [Solitalea sp. MAHUQ-68]|uniref:Twin-arginine translocation signal domain-containing protein n=1 Tax=Solitalea agri TaxID=2953739 RepID=A0A9X2F6A5_9SPHI|nr:twin-arginine translocation signal domain-containing protein [Solitalea agri]MCO4293176.1 twin-arginine translocation signal domain-containing protein [Solitalea agri]
MEPFEFNQPTPRRNFLGILAAGAATLGLSSWIKPLVAPAELLADNSKVGDADAWFNQIKGKHKIVFDVTEPNDILPFAWPKVFLLTNEKTGTPTKECGVVVILRHGAIPFAMENRLWEKYKFGEVFKYDDPVSKAASVRNPFWQPKPDDFKVPGIGAVSIGINDLQQSGVMFCVCDMALTVYSAVVAQGMSLDAAEVKKDWLSGVLPGVMVVPSGVWAVGRAQEHGCAYCFAG